VAPVWNRQLLYLVPTYNTPKFYATVINSTNPVSADLLNTVPPCTEATVMVTVQGVALKISCQVTVTMGPVASKLP
jgi:hypothetical protein